MTNTYRESAHPNEAPLPDPLAYFLTWPTFGTWLPGDDRGWVKRLEGWQRPSAIRKEYAEKRMSEPVCILDIEQRSLVAKTIAEHCRFRGWELFAVNCRSNHLHVVVAANRHPDDVREQFKSWCTRKLNELQVRRRRGTRKNWWAERGSQRYINDENSLEAAILYVNDGQ